MKNSKVIFLLLLPFILEIAASCCRCDAPVKSSYVHCSFTTNNLNIINGISSVSISGFISKDNYGIQLNVNRKELTCSAPTQSFSLMSSAYACSCAPGFEFEATNTITSITVSTVNDFDATHLGGSDITSYFEVNYLSEVYSLTDFIAVIKTKLYALDSFVAGNLSEFIADLSLATAPILGTQHQFEVQIVLSDGQILSQQTIPVDLI